MGDRDEKERAGDDREIIPFEPYRKIARDPLPKQVKVDRKTGKPVVPTKREESTDAD